MIYHGDVTFYRFFTRITDQMRRRLQSYKETIEASLVDLLYSSNLTILFLTANRTEAHLGYATGAIHAAG